MLFFCVRFNLAVLQPVVGGRKEMENVFWMESCAEASPLPAPGRCCHPTAAPQPGPRRCGGAPDMGQHPWVLGNQKRGLRRDSALNPDPHVRQQPAVDVGASGTLITVKTNKATLFSVTPRS